MSKPTAVVLFSGGQDSTTALLKAMHVSDVRGALHVSYGQRHAVETECARRIAGLLEVPVMEVAVPAFGTLADSALVAAGSTGIPHPRLSHLPASFVPGRNLVLLTLAAAYAMKVGATEVWTGVCQTDYSGYPDCRLETLSALEDAVRLGMDFPDLEFHAPLMKLTKADTFELAHACGGLELVLEHTHTCYEGDRAHRHAWGYGCGTCPACGLRAKGWEEFQGRAYLGPVS